MFNNYFSKFFILSLFTCGLVFVQAPLATEAFESWVNPLPGKTVNTIFVTTTADILDSTDGMCSLREAVISANTNPEGLLNAGECQKGSDTITDRIYLLSDATYFLTLAIVPENDSETGDLDVINNSAEIDLEIVVGGDNAFPSSINAGGVNDRVFDIQDATIVMRNLILHKGTGGIRNSSGTVALFDTEIRGMTAKNGAGILNHSGTVHVMEGSFIYNNEALYHGGGIFNGNDGKIQIQDSLIDFNKADAGGGIYNEGSIVIDQDTQVFTNMATEGGSGIYNDEDGRVTINSSQIALNSLSPAILNRGQLNLTDTLLYQNNAGGLHSEGGEVILLRTQVYENSSGHGGGILLSNGTDAKIYQSSIYQNSANLTGGGVYVDRSSLEMANSTVSGNSTEIGIGGGIHLHSGFEGHSIRFYNVTIADNSTKSKKGSALSFVSKTVDIEMVNTIFTGPKDQTVCQNGTVGSLGNNIVSDESCLADLESGDQITAPLLKALEEVDGTMAHLPELESPVFGNGNSAVCAASPISGIDQRGLAREYGCDIGAIELLQAPPPATETPAPSETPITTATPKPGETPVATTTPKPGETPVATATAKPGETPEPGTGESTYLLFLPLVVKN